MDINLLQNLLEELKYNISQVTNNEQMVSLKRKFLGADGLVKKYTKEFISFHKEKKKELGPYFNKWKNDIVSVIREFEKNFAIKQSQSSEIYDYTEELHKIDIGHLHPITKTLSEIKGIFSSLGFEVILGPEIEDVHHNFDALNIPQDHPSRDAWDTMYIGKLNTPGSLLLRTHTSPMQIRVMEKGKPPFRFIVPGKVYRDDTIDASHSAIFHQVEGLCVDVDVNFCDLKTVLSIFLKRFFNKNLEVRFKPSFFPFTEPSAEVDIECIFCNNKNPDTGSFDCRVCKHSGWIEILGAGMVHPNVFKYVNIDPKKYSGFAFGVGVERLAMLKYRINDIRLFLENRLDFLKQF